MNDAANSIILSSDGNYVFAGKKTSFNKKSDAWIVKIDTNGNLIQEKNYGGKLLDEAYCVIELTNSNFAIAGQNQSKSKGFADAWFLGTNYKFKKPKTKIIGGKIWDEVYNVIETNNNLLYAGYTSSFGAGAADAWLIKTLNNGQVIFNQTYGGSDYDIAKCAIESFDGNIFFVGSTESKSAGKKDAWLVKLDASGNLKWQKTYGSSGFDVANDFIQTNDGGFIIVGATDSKGQGYDDVWIIKTDYQGNLLWDTTYGGSGTDIANKILKHNNNEFLIIGSTTSKGKGKEDAWIFKIDAQGNLLWEKTIGGSNSDIANSGFYTTSGGCIICGATSSTGNGGYDAWVIKLETENKTTIDKTPPILTITQPTDNNIVTTYNSYNIKGFTNDNTKIKSVFVNRSSINLNAGYFETNITLKQGINAITIISTDIYDNSTTKTINIIYNQTNNNVDNNIPICDNNYDNRYALIIGNEHYRENGSDIVSLNFTLNDAQVFKKYCINVLGIADDNSHIYYIEDATSMKMIQYIDMFSQLISLKEDAEFFVYYSGHGTLDAKNNAYLIPVDVSSNYIEEHAYKLDDLYTKLAPTNNNKVFIFLDACFSGGGKNGTLVQNTKVGLRRPTQDSIPSNLLIFAASTGTESSQEYPDKGHGLFTYFLLKNLQQSKGEITWGELAENIHSDVLTVTLNPADNLNTQTPTTQVNPSIINSWKTWKINP